MAERKKYGWTIKAIVGIVFLPLGFIFLVISAFFRHFNIGEQSEVPGILLFAFGGMGAVFSLAGLGLLLSDLRRRALLRRAYEDGNYVMAQIASVNMQKNVNINGKNPYVVECHYTEPFTGIVHVYYSRYLYIDVGDLLQSDQVPVYIDRMNDSIGFVDIDAVLPKIQIHR